MTVLFGNDVKNIGTACSTKTSNWLLFVYAFDTKKFANACIHKHIRALTGSTQPTPPPKCLGRAIMRKLRRADSVLCNALLANATT